MDPSEQISTWASIREVLDGLDAKIRSGRALPSEMLCLQVSRNAVEQTLAFLKGKQSKESSIRGMERVHITTDVQRALQNVKG